MALVRPLLLLYSNDFVELNVIILHRFFRANIHRPSAAFAAGAKNGRLLGVDSIAVGNITPAMDC
jgi:hypothetical protein